MQNVNDSLNDILRKELANLLQRIVKKQQLQTK